MVNFSPEDWIFTATDHDLISAVEKYLSIQGTNLEFARRRGETVPLEVVDEYHEWVTYWYKLRSGKKLCLSELQSICGFECVVQILEDRDGSRKYLIKFNPDFSAYA